MTSPITHRAPRGSAALSTLGSHRAYAADRRFSHVLVAVDLGPHSRALVAAGVELATQHAAPLTVLHVAKSYVAPETADDIVLRRDLLRARAAHRRIRARLERLLDEDQRRQLADRVNVQLAFGFPAKAILSAAADAGDAPVIVIGTHGHRRATAAGVGMTAAWVTHEASCAVISVPPASDAALLGLVAAEAAIASAG